MKNKKVKLPTVLFVLIFAGSLLPAVAQDNSSTNPAVVGSRVRSMVELGSVYSNIYDIAITVMETFRGKEAMDRLKAASPDNKMPPAGFDYVLARVKFEIKGRVVSDKLSFDLGDAPLQWVALSSELIEYPRVSVVVPRPALVGKVQPGSSMEGWVAFAVDSKDSKPVMVFDPDTGGATGRGRTLFFRLYSYSSTRTQFSDRWIRPSPVTDFQGSINGSLPLDLSHLASGSPILSAIRW